MKKRTRMKGGKQNQPSWEIMWSVLPDEIGENILSRLPVKSLIRFRCVCKHWCNLIFSPHFIKMHLNRSTQIKGDPKFVRAYNAKVYSIDVKACRNRRKARQKKIELQTEVVLPFKVPSSDIFLNISISCNGLLCLSARDGLYLLNPANKEYKRLTYPKENAYYTATVFGFGYSPRTDEYKVVVISCDRIGHSLRWGDVYVYTLGMNSSWRSIGATEYSLECLSRYHHTLVNGALHWVARSVSMVAISFDIGDEKFRELSLPKSFSQEDTDVLVDLGELGGFLSLYWCKKLSDTYEVWVMKDYGDEQSWTKVFLVTQAIDGEMLKPLYLLEKDVVLCETLYGFFIHDVVKEKCHRLPLKRSPFNSYAKMYFESLVSLRSDGRMDRGNKQEKKEKEEGKLAVGATCN